jgi:hypothetical protein
VDWLSLIYAAAPGLDPRLALETNIQHLFSNQHTNLPSKSRDAQAQAEALWKKQLL